jgi:5-methylcytosine-specific restriction endonuclease McrA
MTNDSSALRTLSDLDLLSTVKTLAENERQATAQLIAALAELDARRLYLGEGCASLFAYCTQVLHLSEHAAYGRIETARTARRYPVILDLLAEGSITLTSVGLLSPHLTEENHRDLVEQARHKSRREVEVIVAGLRPQPPVPSTIRRLPTTTKTPPRQEIPRSFDDVALPSPDSTAPIAQSRNRRPVLAPLTPEQYKIQFTISRETHDKLRRVQDLLRHSIPDSDPAAIFDRALTLLLEHLEHTKLAASTRPASVSRTRAPRSRHIPAAIKRQVWQRDGGQCAFVGRQGRCTERGFLEFHHAVPYAEGGQATGDNIQLRCRSHNAHEAELWFGVESG